MFCQILHALVHKSSSASVISATNDIALTSALPSLDFGVLLFELKSSTISWKLFKEFKATSEFLLRAFDSMISNKSAHALGYSSSFLRICERVENTLATPASVKTQVSAHCFSAVSREWCIKMLPGRTVLSEGGGQFAATDEVERTFSSKGNKT